MRRKYCRQRAVPFRLESDQHFLDRLGEAEAKVVMEATGFYKFLYDAIESWGVEVVLAHPLK